MCMCRGFCVWEVRCLCVCSNTLFQGRYMLSALFCPFICLSVHPSTYLLSFITCQLSSIYIHQFYLLYIHRCLCCLSICPPICVSILASSWEGLSEIGSCFFHWLRCSCSLFIVLCLWCIYLYMWLCTCRRRCPCMQQDVPMCSPVESARVPLSLTLYSLYSDLGHVAGS